MSQVERNHYTFGKYTKIDRWSSYFYQIQLVLSESPEKVLEIGVGEGVLRDYLRAQDIEYTSLDFAKDLNPDVVGDVTNLPFLDNSFDLVCAFEVLEHLPFEKFQRSIDELLRVSRNKVILSLPHFGPPIILDIKIPLLPRIKFAYKIPYFKEHNFDGEHFWEIGKRGFPVSRIIDEITKKAVVEKHLVPFENQYHHFFIIRKK